MNQTPDQLRALVAAGTVTGVDVSPDGRFVVFSSSAGGRSMLYIQSVEGDETPRKLDVGHEGGTQPRWSPSGECIAFLQDIGGDENYRVATVDCGSGEVHDLTKKTGKLHENHSWSQDGQRIAFVSNRDGQFDVYWVDVSSGHVHRVTNHPSVHHSPEFSPDGQRIAYCSNRTELRSNWDTFIGTVSDGTERKITRHEGEADEMSYYAGQRPHWSPDGRHILVSSSIPGYYTITSIDVDSLEQDALVEETYDVINAQWSPDGKRLAYVLDRDGNLVIHVRDLATGRSWPVSQESGTSGDLGMRGKGTDYRWTPDGNAIVYGHMSSTEPGSIWIVDADGGKPKQLYSSLPESVNEDALVRPDIVEYDSFDGVKIHGLLYKPRRTSKRQAAIIMPHGGPTGQSTNTWSPLIQHVVALGYVVFQPNFRGSTGYGRDFQWLNRNDWGGDDLRDVVAAADWLEETGLAAEVGILGGSYGGFMTLSAITKFPDRWRAAVSLYGIANLVTMYQTAREDMRHFQERNIGAPEENPAFYRDRSPLYFTDNITAPILILQGERDPRVTVLEAEQMRDALQASGKEFEYVVYADEGHGFKKLDSKFDYLERIAAFLHKHMPL